MPPEQQVFEFEPIKGYPHLNWKGKRPYTSTQYFPAQSRECIGEEQDGWINRLYWGDNLQVMSHLMKDFRGKIDLIYIDPPFDSKADYKKKIETRSGKSIASDFTTFEDKQYTDIWSNDEYLQFIFERLILMRELLSDKGSIYLHCDYHKSHHLRMVMDEVFGTNNFLNEIIWYYETYQGAVKNYFPRKHDTLFWYSKTNDKYYQMQYDNDYEDSINFKRWESYVVDGNKIKGANYPSQDSRFMARYDKWVRVNKRFPEADDVIFEIQSVSINSVWKDIKPIDPKDSSEKLPYPTQKPEALLERIIRSSCPIEGLVFDCFMGSGTAQAVAMKLGRRFIGADINLGSIQTTMKRLAKIKKGIDEELPTDEKRYTSFKIFNVNNYDFFNNPVQAKDLLIETLSIQKFDSGSCYDGSKDGRMVKIMPINRIASKADISALTANLPYKEFEEIKNKNPHEPVLKIMLVCMGHEPDLKAELHNQLSSYKIDVEIVDILRNEAVLELKREAEADIQRKGNKLIIRKFYPMNLLQKLSLEKTNVSDWKELVDSVMIDWNFDQVEMQPTVIDIPEKNELVKGEYNIPKDAGRIKVKITDLISESFETVLD